ncbi:MAG: PhoPQ-activated pathogenicity-related family protein [Pirellulales bacterium]|nr:PhoPQ-activated pathogenicity-related family protein [Pirellulales bacterium]
MSCCVRRWRSGLWNFYGLLVLASCLSGVACQVADAAEPAARHETALDRYLANGDDSFAWKIASKKHEDGMTTFVIDLTSQTWRTEADVNRTVWKHWLIVNKPDEVKSNKAFLFITGGSNKDEAPSGASEVSANIARATHSVAAELKQVPNQPLEFQGDGKGRVEDDLIAYTWDKYIRTQDETWPARLPMVKSAVRAMDAVQELMASEEGGNLQIDQFVVSGGSKRGWTTWLTGAVDSRVTAIIPIVIDVLNVRPSMEHHYAAYGFWAPAVGNYVQHKIMDRRNHPAYLELLEIEDPYAYRSRLEMPKYIVNAAGDQFFLPDSSQFYFDELPGEKYLRYVANGDHSLRDTDARESVAAFYYTVLTGAKRPQLTWKFADDGSIVAKSDTAPQEVLLWQSRNPNGRDFRVEAVGKNYKSESLPPSADGEYIARVELPKKGFVAFFAEFSFDVGAPFPLKLTTPVRVLPNVLPHAGELDEKDKKRAVGQE